MADSKSEVTTITGSTDVTNLYEIAIENCIKIFDELAKAQPQHTQSISNLQDDYVVAAKNTIENIVSAQKMLAHNMLPIVTPQYADEFVKRSNEITENMVYLPTLYCIYQCCRWRSTNCCNY